MKTWPPKNYIQPNGLINNHHKCIINTVPYIYSEKLTGRPDNYFHNNLDKASVQQIILDPSGSRSGSTTLYFMHVHAESNMLCMPLLRQKNIQVYGIEEVLYCQAYC
jgi:hypothetical protein